jgi:multiple sugar transport system ATP-binding protein
MAGIELKDVVKRYGSVEAVRKMNLQIPDGSFVVLVGPSGCGKTTTLRMIAGLETVTEGTIRLGGRDVTNLEPKDRDVAMVFQNYALYPHMSIYDNIAFGLRARKLPKGEIDERVRRAAAMLDIEPLLKRKPRALSGGQQQRVAIGRATVREPAAFLFDEPLSNLDAKLRVEMREELLRVHKRLGTTVVYVTHDQEEAMTLSDVMVVMSDGEIMQHGTPAEVYLRPAHEFVGRFIGSPEMNLLDGVVKDGILRTKDISVSVRMQLDGEVKVGIRPEDVHLRGELPADQESEPIDARVELIELLGARAIVSLLTGEHKLKTLVEARALEELREGQSAQVAFDLKRLHAFDARTGERIDESGRRFDGSV